MKAIHIPNGRQPLCLLCALSVVCAVSCSQSSSLPKANIKGNSGESPPNSSEVQTRPITLLACVPHELTFGTIAKGGTAEVRFTLRNPDKEAVEITAIKTSCDCFMIELPTMTVAGNSSIEAIAMVNLATDPKFTGSLALEATGQTSRDKPPAFVLRASVKVK